MHGKKTVPSLKKLDAEFLLELTAIQKETTDFIYRQAERSMRATLKTIKHFKKSDNLFSPTDSAEIPDPVYVEELYLAFTYGERYFQSLLKAMKIIKQAEGRSGGSKTLVWSGSKVSLIELAYALKVSAVFNGGNATIQDIVTLLERSFHSDLGNASRTFQVILARKKGSTSFIDKLKVGLESYIDNIEENHAKKQAKRKA